MRLASSVVRLDMIKTKAPLPKKGQLWTPNAIAAGAWGTTQRAFRVIDIKVGYYNLSAPIGKEYCLVHLQDHDKSVVRGTGPENLRKSTPEEIKAYFSK